MADRQANQGCTSIARITSIAGFKRDARKLFRRTESRVMDTIDSTIGKPAESTPARTPAKAAPAAEKVETQTGADGAS